EALGQETRRTPAALPFDEFVQTKNTLAETLAKTFQRGGEPADLDQIGADTGNRHRRASTISRFISRTASASPENTARAMMAWPILSSASSGMAATGCTL